MDKLNLCNYCWKEISNEEMETAKFKQKNHKRKPPTFKWWHLKCWNRLKRVQKSSSWSASHPYRGFK